MQVDVGAGIRRGEIVILWSLADLRVLRVPPNVVTGETLGIGGNLRGLLNWTSANTELILVRGYQFFVRNRGKQFGGHVSVKESSQLSAGDISIREFEHGGKGRTDRRVTQELMDFFAHCSLTARQVD
ncbi:hypothetical protein ASF88_12465 [Leifsonia sp. Leaf336]|nr:hypothetical protein ASF88_12465 [Leifsonia sp. Leaf336]